MDWIDIVVIAYILLGAISGLRRGFMLVVFSLMGYIAGLALAIQYKGPLTSVLLSRLPVRHWVSQILPAPASAAPQATIKALHLVHSLAGLLVILVVVTVMELFGRFIGELATRFVRVFHLTGMLNRIGGGVVGLAEHIMVAGLLLTLLLSFPLLNGTPISSQLHQSPLAMQIVSLFGRLVKLPGGKYL